MHIDSTDVTLKRYLDDIRKTAPLSRDEEQILFQKAKEGEVKPKIDYSNEQREWIAFKVCITPTEARELKAWLIQKGIEIRA